MFLSDGAWMLRDVALRTQVQIQAGAPTTKKSFTGWAKGAIEKALLMEEKTVIMKSPKISSQGEAPLRGIRHQNLDCFTGNVAKSRCKNHLQDTGTFRP